MADPTSQDKEPLILNPRLVRALRIALVLFLLPLLALTVLFVLSPKLPLPYLTAVVSLVLCLVVLWGIRTSPPKRLGLGLAIALGSMWVVVFGLYGAQFTASLFRPAHRSRADIALLLSASLWVLTLLQGAYVGLALKLRRSMPSGHSHLPRLVGTIVGGIVLGFMVIFTIAFEYSMRIPGQAPAAGMLRTINTADITYAITYGGSYTSSLAELAPPPKGMQPSASAAGLIQPALAGGTVRFRTYIVADDIVDEIDLTLGRGVKHSYRIIYKPGQPVEHGRIDSYTICARPIDKALAPNSYFTDETGVIRMTGEDRCPTPQDWPIAG